MRSRGARIWSRDEAAGRDLFELPAPPPPATPAPAPARAVPTNAECRVMERAIEAFKLWLLAASIAQLEAAKPAELAKKFPPIEAWDIEQMISVRLAGQRRAKR